MRVSIKTKILLLIFGIIATVIFGLCVYLNYSLTNITIANLKAQLQRQTKFAEQYLLTRMSSGTTARDIDVIADQIGRSLKLRVSIIDADGVVLGDSELNREQLAVVENHRTRPEVVAAFRHGYGEAERYSSTIDEDLLYYALRIEENPYISGLIRLSVKLSTVDVLSQKMTQILILGIVTALVLVLVFSYVATALVSKPITEISQIAREIANGNFDHSPRIYSNDEIGDLSKSINYMSKQISQRIYEVSQNRSRLEAVFLNMFDGIMIVANDGSIMLTNDMLKEFIHFEDDPIGKKPLQVVRNIEIKDIIDDILKYEEKFLKREIHVHDPDEKILLVHASAIEHDGEKDGAVLVFHDITEMRKLETMRRDFVANVSHELRTPITSIKGYAETLSEGALSDRKAAEEFVNIIKVDAERLGSLVDDILDLSKIESGKFELQKEPVQLKKVIDRVLLVVANKSKKHKIDITAKIAKDIDVVNCDEFSLEQVLINLLENAIKYNKENGSIVIDVKETPEEFVFDVQDTGIGIPEKDLPRIFEKFYRVDKARSREIGGTGLGLSIVKHLVQAHYGKVSVDSELNVGTTFTFTIPKY